MIHTLFTHAKTYLCLLTMLLVLVIGQTLQAQSSREVTVVVKTPGQATRRVDDVDIKLYARPITDGAKTTNDIQLNVKTIQPIQSVSTGRASAYKVTVELPANITRESYGLWAYIDAGNTVTESNLGAVDLVIEFGRVTLPQRIVSGGKGVARFPVTITNKGDLAAVRQQRIDIKIVARPATAVDESQDVTIATAANESIGGMEPGETIKVVLIGEFPGQLPVQSYNIIAVADSSNTVNERDENNNTAQMPDTIAVTGQNIDLLVDLNNVQLPKGIVSGSEKQITVPIKISNAGNLGFDLDQTVDVKIVARPALNIDDDSEDVLLAFSQGNSLAQLGPGKTMELDIEGKLPPTMAKGTYTMRVIIDPTNRVKEANESNNVAMLLEPISVLAKVVDLDGQLMDAHAPRRVISGESPLLVMPLRITNSGSVPFSADAPAIDIKLIARPDDALDQTGDIVLNQIKDRPVSGLMPGQSMIVNLDVALPADMQHGRFKLIAIVDASNKIEEADETNNTPEYEHTMAVEKPFVDLVAGIVTLRPARAIVSGSDHVLTVPVKVANKGNVRPNANVPVNIRVSGRPLGALDKTSNDVELGVIENVNLGDLEPGTEKLYQAQAKFPARMPAGKYVLVAQVDSDAVVVEPDDENNYAVAPVAHALEIAAPRVDLGAQIVNLNLPTSVIAGQGTVLALPVKIINQGNIALPADQYVDIKVSARKLGADGDKDIDLALDIDKPVASLAPGDSLTFTSTVTIPSNVESGKYLLVAHVDATNKLKEEDEANNLLTIAPGQAFDVVAPVIDLVADIVNPLLPPSTVAGHGPDATIPVQVTNAGNVAVAADTQIDIKVFAKPVNGEKEMLVSTLASQPIGKLASGQSVTFSANARVPVSAEKGRYVFIARVDTSDVVTETTKTNNTAQTAGANAWLVAEPFVDLAINIDSAITTAQAIAGHSQPVTATLRVTNMGNIPTGPQTKLRISMFCSSDNGQSKTELTELGEVEAGNLQSGQSIVITAKGSFPATLTAGRYVLGASLLNSRAAGDEKAANDMAIQVAADAVNVVRPFVDLALALDPVSLPGSVIAGYAKPITLPLRLTNQGNIAMPESMQVNLRIHAVNTGEGGQRVAVGSLEAIEVGALAPGASVMAPASVSLPATLAAGQYNLTAEIDPTTATGDTDPANNRVATVKAHAISVSRPFIDIASAIVSPSVPAQVIAGHGPAFEFVVRLTNQGNVPLPADQKLTVSTYAVSTTNKSMATRIDQQNVNVDGLGAGSSVDASMVLLIPSSVSVGDYGLRVQVEPAGDALVETSRDNNVAVTTANQAIKVLAPFVDLVGQFDSAKLPRQIVAGHASEVTVPIHITNQGNIALDDKAAVGVKLFARPLDRKAQDIVLATLSDQSLAGLASGSVRTLDATVKFPPAMGVGRYLVGLEIDTASQVTESDENNNNQLADQGLAMQVDAPRYDLIGSLETVRPSGGIILEAQKVSVYVKIANRGNIPLDAKQTVDVMLYARPVSLGKLPDMDLQLGRMASLDVSGLAPGLERTFREEVMFSTTNMPTDDYVIVARIDSTDLLREVDETNNIAKAEDRVIALGRRFRIKNMPVPFDSDGPRRYMVNGITIQYKGLPADPSVQQLKALELKLTKSYAGLVAQRYEEESQRMTVGQLTEVKDTYLYRSAVRVLCARIADHLETVGKGDLSVHPAYDQIDIKGEDLRPDGQTGLTIVIEKAR
ncbi:MAG: hypothetical protein CMJ19_12715 [Phycisphaeraceae bacterium]|nr:hypothetical protein [Phycisphaeraceae bacterium]